MQLTVITVTRNCAASIAHTLDSVARQTMACEHLIIDGVSSDGTLDIVRAHANKNLVVVSEPDRSIYDAMNKGIARATGQWLIFLNADDEFPDDDALKNAMELVAHAAAPGAIHYFDFLYFSRDGLLDPVRARTTFTPHKGMTICHQAIVYPAAVFRSVGCYDLVYRFAGDYEHLVRCQRAGVDFVHHDLVLAKFSVGGLSQQHMKKTYGEIERVLRTNFGRWAAWRFRMRYVFDLIIKWLGKGIRAVLGQSVYKFCRSSLIHLLLRRR